MLKFFIQHFRDMDTQEGRLTLVEKKQVSHVTTSLAINNRLASCAYGHLACTRY